jgi:hypothetical protein
MLFLKRFTSNSVWNRYLSLLYVTYIAFAGDYERSDGEVWTESPPFPGRCSAYSGHDLQLRGFTVALRHTTLLWTSDQSDGDTSDNTQHSQQIDIYTSAGFEPAIPGSELPQTHALGRAATGFDFEGSYWNIFKVKYRVTFQDVQKVLQYL